ncbi:prolyl 4-hydroxylase subunit alpha-1-like [Condylostylus longicornis]|uniref:prolyl 4-hydroxylase subunit alpha-1-like n=1 Tax=Condylostylus longicornis TaxID=2530218 RepID=UPI00244DAD7D|nr:prolyl 4-hydroxylase subunit alpha-1-like [Condylostylus longicornis]
MMRIFLYTAVLLCLSYQVNPEVFTAMTDMEDLLDTELALIHNLEEYINMQEKRLEFLKLKVTEYQKEHNEATEDVATYLANPINAYLLTKRLTSDWSQIENLIQETSDRLIKNITDHKNVLKFPSDEDLNGAAVALIRLQDTYRLDTSSVARGELNGIQYSTELSSDDCFELGRQAYKNGDYHHTILWMQEALDKIENDKEFAYTNIENQTVKTLKVKILEYLSFSVYKKGNLAEALALNDQILEIDPSNEQGTGNKYWFNKELKEAEAKKLEFSSVRGDTGDSNVFRESLNVEKLENLDHLNYEKLCRGDITPTPTELRSMKCYYIHNNVPFLRIAPIKVEVANKSPRLLIFHDVITDSEIDKVIEIGKPRLQRATARESTGYVPVKYRISKSGWISHDEDPLITSIIQRVSDMTMLTTESAEDLQVCNYGIGGHYEPHFDFTTGTPTYENERWQRDGNRIATVLFYMSDVPQGGSTVFPAIGKSVWPKKGSAAFWFNLFADGEGDLRTKHAACPVLTGSKWVANLWIHERGQVCYPDSFQERSIPKT